MTKHLRLCAGLAAVASAVLAGCTFAPSNRAPATTTSVNFPYPPVHDILEIAVPLDPQLADAAKFGVDAYHTRAVASNNQSEDLQRYYATIAADLKPTVRPLPRPDVPSTGGETFRAVRATAEPDGQVIVDVCAYNVPGVYQLGAGGTTLTPNPNPNAYGLSRMTVEKTTAESADGARPTEPRWLVTNEWIKVGLDPVEERRVCEPFKPDPWVQKMPDPTAPLRSPTTTAPGK